MAILKAPLLSIEAQGAIGDELYFSKTQKQNIARNLIGHSDTKSISQMYHRWLVRDYFNYWNTLTSNQKSLYHKIAIRKGISNFNAWMSHQLINRPDIVASYRMDETTGTSVIDTGPNLLHGTIPSCLHTPGLVDYSVLLDGVDNRITIPHNLLLTFSLTSFSISLALKITNVIQAERGFISKFSTLTFAGWLIWINASYNIGAYLLSDATTYLLRLTSTSLQANSWYRLVSVVDRPNNSITNYLNGIDDNSALQSAGGFSSGSGIGCTTPLYIGYMYLANNKYFPGYIDDVIIYNRLLSPEEALSISSRKYPL